MEYHPKKRGIVARVASVTTRWWLNLACAFIAVITSMPALANLPACDVVFPTAAQSHQSGGEINFDWNAQLLGNPGAALAVTRVNDSSWSMLASCGVGPCSATGGHSTALDITFQTSISTTDHQVGYRANQSLGTNQLNHFRNITVESEGVLNLAAIATDYRIKNLTLGYAATLNLAPGTYWVETLTLATSTQIKVIGEGSARLLVRNNVSFPWQSFANMTAAANPGDAKKLFIYAENDVTLQSGSQVSAIVYTQKQLHIAQAELYGRASFHHATLGTSARIQYQADNLSLNPLPGICGVQETTGDNPAPASPPGESGGGSPVNACLAAFSNGLQAHGSTGLITFQYNAQLRNASSQQLSATNVQVNTGSNQRSCETAHCTASGSLIDKLDAGSFLHTSVSRTVNVPWMGSATLNGTSALEYGQVVVAGGSTLTLTAQAEPYRVRELRLGYQSTLKLPAGDYWVERLVLETEVSIQALGSGTVRLYVKDALSVTWMTTINGNTQNPAQFILYHYGDLEFSSGSKAHALVYGDGQVKLNYQVPLVGAIAAGRILLDTESQVVYTPNSATNADFGQICTDTSSPDDVDPPQLSINPLPAETENTHLLITGTVIDPVHPQGGVADVVVTSDRLTGQTFNAVVQGQSFSVEVPLLLGNNTLTIVARDLSGNTTQLTRQIRRLSLPTFHHVTPATGSVLGASSITLAGEIHSPSPLASVRFYINEWQVTPSATAVEGVFSFSQTGLALNVGQNTFVLRAETPYGSAEYPVVLTHNPDNPGAIPLPNLSLLAPVNGSYLRDTTFVLRGRVTSHAGEARVSVNGQLLALPATNRQDYYFETLLTFPAEQNSLDVLIEASDALGRGAQLTARYHRDDAPPQITILGGLQPSPAINTVLESPFTVSGRVFDTNLTSLTVNDQPIALSPGSLADHYDFSVAVSPGRDALSSLLFSAYDISGNRTSVEYIFQSSARVGITPLLPGEGAEFIARGEPVILQAAARLSDVEEGYAVRVSIGAQPFNLVLAGTLASGDIALPTQAGDYTLVYQVIDETQTVIATTERRVRVINEQAIPLEIVRHFPGNNAINIEPNQPIELYFNKPVDASDLTLRVTETLHGQTYINMDMSGTDFLNAQGYQLQNVYRDNEIVPGAVSLLPGNQSLAFYGARHYGFNANIFVDVIYQGDELVRFQFRVRPLPTFVIGGVANQFGQPLAGIPVELSGYGITRTNQDGSFAFGFQQSAEHNIPAGRHRLVINPDFDVPGYGVQVRTINLQAGRRNEISLSQLPELHPDIPFQLVSSGQVVSLANDDLRLDLTNARLLANHGRRASQMQAQFIPFGQINAAMTPGAWPQWLFAIQPRGVGVEGNLAIELNIPALNGSHDYISPDMHYVVLLGYDPEREVIEPVGIGRIEHNRVISVGKVTIKALDYVGYALVEPSKQSLLQAVVDETLTMQQLLSALRQ